MIEVPGQSSLFPLLPKYTFITGANGSGKTTLANLLFDSVMGLQSFSFAAPIDDGIRAMFYGNDPLVNLKDEAAKLEPVPGFPAVTLREAKNKFGDALRSIFGPLAMGEIALSKVKLDDGYFERFVFDDARRLADVRPIVEAYGKENTLMIDIMRPGYTLNRQTFTHDEALRTACGRFVTISNDGEAKDLPTRLQAALIVS